MSGLSPYLLLPLLLSVALLQATALPELKILGVKPELMLLLVLAWSLLRSSEEGLLWAFVGGMMLDLFSGGPFGTSTLGLLVVSFFAGLVEASTIRASLLLPMIAALLGTLLYQGLFLLIIQVTRGNVPWVDSLLQVTLPSLAVNALLMPLVFQIAVWLDRRVGRQDIRW
ncbi:MAG: rod shape-determining protein MreD [Anaerolineaceae bacterium 4572_32.1]|nr:MAG: rod shape-determining protein MreD [Anaerolineaceae bacterium 4572_32.1]